MLKNFSQNYIFCLSMTWPVNKRIDPFTNVPIMGFENNSSLKKHIFWLCYPRLMWKADPKRGGGGGGGKKLFFEVCKSVNDTCHFKRRDTDKTFNILKGPLDYSFNHVIYLF